MQEKDKLHQNYKSLHQEALKKAAQARGRNQRILKNHYLAEASRYEIKIQQTESEYFNEILRFRNHNRDENVLDLHVLTVAISLDACETFLKERREFLRSQIPGTKLTLSIITGWGRHSQNGEARIKPAVHQFFRDRGFKIRNSRNPGVLNVFLTA